MEYQKIHACPNDCILYRNEFAETSDVVTVENNRPTNVCWYLPIIPRFKQLFANGHDEKQLM